jgi:hypothetical protein
MIGKFGRSDISAPDRGSDYFSEVIVLDPEDGHLGYCRMGKENSLHFCGIDVFAASDNHILETSAGEHQLSVAPDLPEIACLQPTIDVDYLQRLAIVGEIPTHNRGTFDLNFAYRILAEDRAAFRIRNPNTVFWQGPARGLEAVWIVWLRTAGEPRRFSQSIRLDESRNGKLDGSSPQQLRLDVRSSARADSER